MFTGGELTYAPVLAAIALGAALVAAEYLAPADRPRVRPLGALAFAGYFAAVSAAGGVDVARRALRPRPRLRPAFADLRIDLESGAAAARFAAAVSLVPGTLCAKAGGGAVTVHVIDEGRDYERDLRALEARVAGVFRRPGEGSRA